MPDNEFVSQGDLYHKLGTLEGKIESVLLQLAEKRSDVNNLFARVRAIENKVAWGMGAAAIISVVVPLVVTSLSPRIQFSTNVDPVQLPKAR